jgi:SAM-dependent methyltransferase
VSEPDTYSFRRYLDAKRTVDERARDGRVRDAFVDALGRADDPVCVFEAGAGTGTLAARIREWTADRAVEYVAVDADPDLVAAARETVASAAEAEGRPVERSPERVVVGPGAGGAGRFDAEFRAADALDVLEGAEGEYDAVVAQAFLDLTDVPAALEAVGSALAPGGVGYFPITFDGVTAFLPRVGGGVDDRIERRFHRHMDTTEKAGGATGDSTAGRRVLAAAPRTGGRVLAAGGSDWVVAPDDGGYPADEAYFLHHLVETVRGALADDPAVGDRELSEWAAARHDQVAAGELTYLTHQLDVLVGWDGDRPAADAGRVR